MYRAVRHALRALAVAGMLAGIAACDAEPEQPAPPEDATPPAEGEATVLTVVMVDYDLELPEAQLAPGTYTFVAEQQGEVTHALSIEGPGVSESTPWIAPGGGSEEFTVTLEPGTYQLWCPVANHRELGMETEIEVS